MKDLRVIFDILQKYEYYFYDTFTDYKEQGCEFYFEGKVFDIYKKDKPTIETIIAKLK